MSAIEWDGTVHPAADDYPLMTDDEVAALAEGIAAIGLIQPLGLKCGWPVGGIRRGPLVDGRNRLRACELAGVPPRFEDIGDIDPYDYAEARNVDARSLSNGQKAMQRARNLARQGKRSGGRWVRGSVDIQGTLNIGAWREQMKKAGLVLDVAAKAAAMRPAPGIDQSSLDAFATLPDQVMARATTLDAAYNLAQKFEATAALAELALYQPLAEWIGHHEQLSADAAERHGTPPRIDAPIKKEHADELGEIARRYAAVAASIRAYVKEAK